MNLVNLRIGTGPDFVMMIGKIIYSHRAIVRMAFNSGATTRETLSNPSLCALIRKIQEVLVAIGWDKKSRVDWIAGEKIAGDSKGEYGTAVIKFKFPREISADQELKMRTEIKRLFE